jgi:zinc protease
MLAVACPLRTAGADDGIAVAPAIVRGRLANGLTYYIQHNTKPEKRAELRLVVNAGSAVEDEDQRGLAHLIEHLCFRGTKHFPQSSLVHYLQSIGSDFGPHVNGFTSFDETVYRLTVPSDSEEALKTGMQMLRDWAGDVSFDKADLDKERQVVIEEWRMRLGADQRLFEQALPVVFKDSRYAERLPIGKKEVVENAPVETIRQFYRDWYRPDNMAVVVVGDIDCQKIEARLRSLFGDLQAPARLRPKPDLSVPISAGVLYSATSDPEMGSNIVRVSFPHPTKPVNTVADYRSRLARTLAIQALNGRLNELRDCSPSPFLFAQASFGISQARARSELTLLALVSDGGVAAGLGALIQESERARRFGFTAEEFAREKRKLLKAVEEEYTEREKRESEALADACVAYFLQKEPNPGPEWSYIQSKAGLDQMSLDDLNQACRGLCDIPATIVRVETPQKPGLPPVTVAELQKVVSQSKSAPIEPYHGKTGPTTLMAQLPTPGTLVSRKTIESIGVTELTLSNGVRVVLKPSTFKQDEAFFSAYRPGGLSSLPETYDLAAKFAPGYLAEAGLGPFSKTDLQKLMAGRQVLVGARIDPYIDLIRGQCSAVDLETALQLVHLCFAEPRRDENVYKSVLAINNTFETNVVLNPVLSFINETIDLRYNHHPRLQRLVQPENAWKELTLDKVLEAYRKRFSTAGGFTFMFVGSFTPEAVEPLIARYLGSLPASSGDQEWKDLGIRQIPGPFKQTIERGTDPKALLLFYDERDAEWTLRDTHLVWSLGNILQRVLIDKLRIEQGSVYTLKVTSTLEKIPYGHYTLEIALPCGPENTETVAKYLDEEIERIRRNGPTADEIQKEVESQKRALQKEAENNGDWLWKLELIYKYNEGFGRLTSPNGLVELVTAENLQAAARKYWRTDKWVRFELRPKTLISP